MPCPGLRLWYGRLGVVYDCPCVSRVICVHMHACACACCMVDMYVCMYGCLSGLLSAGNALAMETAAVVWNTELFITNHRVLRVALWFFSEFFFP